MFPKERFGPGQEKVFQQNYFAEKLGGRRQSAEIETFSTICVRFSTKRSLLRVGNCLRTLTLFTSSPPMRRAEATKKPPRRAGHRRSLPRDPFAGVL